MNVKKMYSFLRFAPMLAVFLGCVTTQSTDVCAKGYKNVCNSTIEQEIIVIPTVLPPKEFLKEKCSAALDQVRCFANHRSICPLSWDGPYLMILRSASELVLFAEEACNESSSLRQDYLQHVDCLNNHSQEIKETIMSVILDVVHFWEGYTTRNYTRYTQTVHEALVCVVLSEMKTPGERTVGQACGQQALYFMWKVTNLLLKPNEAECSEPDETTQYFLRLYEESSVKKPSS